MVATNRSRGRLPWLAFALGLGVWSVFVSSSFAQQPACNCPVPCSKNPRGKHHKVQNPRPPGGFQGFGLGYHLGYGYGGTELGLGHGPYAMGVGPDGGYPYYGGPGYPHPAPVLSRKLPIVPFCYFGGPGYPTPENPNFYGGPGGQLVPDRPVVTFEPDPTLPFPEQDYGQFTGSLPYPESAFAPFATMVGEYGMNSGGGSNANSTPPASGALGMKFEPFGGAGFTPGLKVVNVIPGSVVDRGGLHAGDVVVSINGYVTQKLTDPDWIILNASPDKVLKMNVRFASDGKDHEVTVQLP